jgi:hypothetical protein
MPLSTRCYYGQSIAPGEDLDLHILDNDVYGSNV